MNFWLLGEANFGGFQVRSSGFFRNALIIPRITSSSLSIFSSIASISSLTDLTSGGVMFLFALVPGILTKTWR
jgi:hypothetical protein